VPAPLAPELLGREQVTPDQITGFPCRDQVDPIEADPGLVRPKGGDLLVLKGQGIDRLGIGFRQLPTTLVVWIVVAGPGVLGDHA
jgi:hypothetical protein